MAFNRKTFQTRALTAIVFAAVMLVGLLWNQWSFLVLFSIIHFGCWWEYFNLLEKIHNTSYHLNTRFGFMLMGYALMLWFCGPVFQINGYSIHENFPLLFSIAGFVMLVIGIFQSRKIRIKAFGAAALGLAYISLSWGLMISFYDFQIIESIQIEPFPNDTKETTHSFKYPWIIPVAIIVSIWVNDTMAYIVGSLIGKRQLSSISPKKTWEGTIGGIILCVAVIGTIFLSVRLYPRPVLVDFRNHDWFLISGIAAIAGTFGDLFESKLKRMAGVKDSGNIMPGHGGFLDRFDSLLLATPAVWLYVYFLI